MMMEINRLPAEMLLEVHRRLSPSALKKAVLVDKLWRDVGEDPTLWEWCKVTVYSKEDIDNLSIKRLKRIQEIFINPDNWDVHDWEAFFRAVKEFSSLKQIDGLDRWWPNLKLVEPALFAGSMAKLEVVGIVSCTYHQIEELFKVMSTSTRVKTFVLCSDDLSQMDPGLFARVLSKLENLLLNVEHVTRDQMQAFFTEVLNNRSLKTLDLQVDMDYNIWSYLEPGFFGRVLSTVEDVSLTATDVTDVTDVTSDHIEALFTELSVGTQLKRLCLNDFDISQIEPALIANALSGLEELHLKNTFISPDQIQALFTQISLRSEMMKLALVEQTNNSTVDPWLFGRVDPGLFGRVMARLEDLTFRGIEITTNQLLAFFTEMSGNSHLKSVDIGCSKLSLIDPQVLAAALTRLEAVTLWGASSLSNDQVTSLFNEMSRNTVMKEINLTSRTDMSSVDPEVLASALIRLEEVTLAGTVITHHQARALFREMSQNCQLKRITFDDFDFSSVDPDVFATAVTNVKEVNFCRIILSTEQIDSIFTHVLEGDKKLKRLSLIGIGRAAADVNPHIMRKVKEKLKGQLDLKEHFP